MWSECETRKNFFDTIHGFSYGIDQKKKKDYIYCPYSLLVIYLATNDTQIKWLFAEADLPQHAALYLSLKPRKYKPNRVLPRRMLKTPRCSLTHISCTDYILPQSTSRMKPRIVPYLAALLCETDQFGSIPEAKAHD
jgi:hypothetical protein